MHSSAEITELIALARIEAEEAAARQEKQAPASQGYRRGP